MKRRTWGLILTGGLYLITVPFWNEGWLPKIVSLLTVALFANTLFSPWVVKKSRFNPFTGKDEGPK